MWALIITIASLIAAGTSDIPIDRQISDGVKSAGYELVYGDEELTLLNEVVSDYEKSAMKNKVNIHEQIPELPAQDVKCLMSVDKYCSKEMGQVKSILIQALKDDCKVCTVQEKEKAGKVVASMMAHDPVAWKLFLTRCALQLKPPTTQEGPENLKLLTVGEPEEVVGSKRFIQPGFKVRVKRYLSDRIE